MAGAAVGVERGSVLHPLSSNVADRITTELSASRIVALVVDRQSEGGASRDRS